MYRIYIYRGGKVYLLGRGIHKKSCMILLSYHAITSSSSREVTINCLVYSDLYVSGFKAEG